MSANRSHGVGGAAVGDLRGDGYGTCIFIVAGGYTYGFAVAVFGVVDAVDLEVVGAGGNGC